MKKNSLVLFSGLAALVSMNAVTALAAGQFPLQGHYTMEFNSCMSFVPVGAPMAIESDAAELRFERVLDCSAPNSGCRPGETSVQDLGEYSVGKFSNFGTSGTVLYVASYSNANNSFAFQETLTNDVAGGGPTAGTSFSAEKLGDRLNVMFDGIACVLSVAK